MSHLFIAVWRGVRYNIAVSQEERGPEAEILNAAIDDPREAEQFRAWIRDETAAYRRNTETYPSLEDAAAIVRGAL